MAAVSQYPSLGVSRAGGAAVAACLLAGCSSPIGYTPQVHELVNMRDSNVIPKSSPKQLVSAFQDYCMVPEGEAEAVLRTDGYVKVPSRDADRIATYLVDDRRPAVMIDGDTSCAVVAESRTGQTNAIEDFVATTFPAATRTKTPDGGDLEAVWATPSATLFINRKGGLGLDTRLMFGIQRH